MDLTSKYCPERKRLEHRTWNLVSRHFELTGRLMVLVGKDHSAFMATKATCTEVKLEILEFRDHLRAHRAAHGC